MVAAGECLDGWLCQGRALVAATDAATRPLIFRLDPELRAKVVMALLAIILVGGLLVAFAILGGRRARRLARERAQSTATHGAAWYQKPLSPGDSAGPRAADPE
jgi:hypothetical protein